MPENRIPLGLATLPQWVCWRLEPDPKGGKDRKVPYDPKTSLRASSTNPATWATLEAALAAKEQYTYSGLGYVFTKESGIVGIDIDHCRDSQTGALNEIAAAITQRLSGTYGEISPSGTGIHLFVQGDMPGKGNKNSETGVEMYAHSRFFTYTGLPLPGAPDTILKDDGALQWIHETYVKPPKAAKEKATKKKRRATTPIELTDEEVLEKARNAKNAETFIQLWDGNWQTAFFSQSEADLALCCSLAFWTGKNKEQMERLFRQCALFRPKWDVVHHASGATYGEETLSRAMELTEDIYAPDIDNSVFEKDGRYFRSKGDSVYPLTNFLFHPVEMIEAEDETQMTADLVTVRGQTFRQTLLTTDFNNLQRFKGVINKRTIALSYTGSEGDLEILKGYVSDLEWTRKRGIKALGIHASEDGWIFVAGSNAMRTGGTAVDNVVQLEKYRSIDTEVHRYEAIPKEALKKLGPLLLSYNEPAKTVAVLAWCAGCFLKEHLRRAHIKYPHLFLIGEAGSGKSNTLERVILPIFARTRVVAATQVTSFTLMKESASSNIIPQALDEFKPSKIDRIRLHALYNHMRDTYDGHEGVRGRADQTSISYALLAPLVVAGEESPDEAAIRERSMELLFSKRDLKDASARAAFQALCRVPDTLSALGRALLDAALSLSEKDVVAWYDAALPLFGKELPSRILNNLACCVAGLRLIEAVCIKCGLTWDEVFNIDMAACAEYLQYAAREFLLDGGETNKSVVEQTLEVIDRMGLDVEEVKILEDGAQIAIHFKGVYDRYTKYRRDHAIIGECLSYAQFMRQLWKSDLFIETRVVRFGSETKKAAVLNYAALRKRCDISGFSGTEVEPL